MEEVDENLDKYLGLTSFIDGVRRYKSNNNVFIIVYDQFKYFYSKETLSQRYAITRIIKSITDQARAYFDKRLKLGIIFLHSIAKLKI